MRRCSLLLPSSMRREEQESHFFTLLLSFPTWWFERRNKSKAPVSELWRKCQHVNNAMLMNMRWVSALTRVINHVIRLLPVFEAANRRRPRNGRVLTRVCQATTGSVVFNSAMSFLLVIPRAICGAWKLLGSLSKHDVDGSENVIWKCNFAVLQSFFNYSKSLCLKNVF